MKVKTFPPVSLRLIATATLAGSVFASVSCDIKKTEKDRPNILYIITDQQRADSLHCSGNNAIQTPNIDRLATEGVRFTNAFAVTGQCMPSRTTILTGRYPHAHGVFCNGDRLPDEELTVAEILNPHGYRSVAVGKMHFARNDTTHGFDHFEINEHFFPTGNYRKHLDKHGIKWDKKHNPYGPPLNPNFFRHLLSGKSHIPEKYFHTAYTADVAIKKLQELRSSQPFALWVGFNGPHPPYTPPEPWASKYNPKNMPLPKWIKNEFHNKPKNQKRYFEQYNYINLFPFDSKKLKYYLKDRTAEDFQFLISRYYGYVSMIDHYVGKILNELERLKMKKNTIVVFTSDHGDYLGEHHLAFKSTALNDALTHTPLIIRYPGKIPGDRVIKELISHVDHLPTLLALAGIPAPMMQKGFYGPVNATIPLLQGISYAPLLYGRPFNLRRKAIFFESGCSYFGSLRFKGLRTLDFRYTIAPHFVEELYDLRKDPGALYNVARKPGYSNNISRARGALLWWISKTEIRPVYTIR